jgi:spore maturation protein CgeB
MKILCVFSQYNYGDPRRGESYEYFNFIPALRRLGHSISFFESWNRSGYRNFRELNDALLKKVEQERPDVIVSVLVHYEIWQETWRILRDSGMVATINWATDDSWRYAQFSRWVAPGFHAFSTTYPSAYQRYHEDGIFNVILTQWAANADQLQPPLPASQCTYKVTFIGSAHGERRARIQALRQCGIPVECFGYGWENGAIPASEISRIIRHSVVSLNFANGVREWQGLMPHTTRQIKARTFEVPGAGGFLLTEWCDGLDQYYEVGKEIESFGNLKEAAEKIRYYCDHPEKRDSIAQAGYTRTCKEHIYDIRFSKIVEFALHQRKQYFAQPSIAAPTGTIDWERFRAAAAQHALTGPAKWSASVLSAAGALIWGKEKGRRAARRLIFECSWRVMGARTYSAAGLPGRMFYEAS